jgi:O-antigen/teichoic acid export membrane protein
MEATDVIQKSIIGTKWAIILSFMALPLSYLTNIILGRVSPDALGTFSVINIYIPFILTFVLFGGSNLISKYLPEVEDEMKSSFLVSYILVIFTIGLIIVFIICMFSDISKYVAANLILIDSVLFTIIFSIVVIMYNLTTYVLNGLMEIKASIILRQAAIFSSFSIFAFFFLLSKEFFLKNSAIIICGVYLVTYGVLALAAFVLINKKIKFKKQKFYLPKAFWNFAIFVHLSTIAFFFSDKIDQLLILDKLNIYELGLYYAALQTAMLIRFIPLLIGNILLPTFSNLLAINEAALILAAYKEIIKYTTLIVVPIALIFIFFSRDILSLFGEEYRENYNILIILSLFFSYSAIGTVNNSLIISKGKAKIYFLCEASMSISATILMFFLINQWGVLGLAIGRGAAVALWQLVSIIIIHKYIDLDLKIPRPYKVGLIISTIAFVLNLTVNSENIYVQMISFAICLIAFLYYSQYSLNDVKSLFNKVVSKN